MLNGIHHLHDSAALKSKVKFICDAIRQHSRDDDLKRLGRHIADAQAMAVKQEKLKSEISRKEEEKKKIKLQLYHDVQDGCGFTPSPLPLENRDPSWRKKLPQCSARKPTGTGRAVHSTSLSASAASHASVVTAAYTKKGQGTVVLVFWKILCSY